MNRDQAIETLREIADGCNEVRHPLQFLYPQWKGRPLDKVLIEIADALAQTDEVAVERRRREQMELELARLNGQLEEARIQLTEAYKQLQGKA